MRGDHGASRKLLRNAGTGEFELYFDNFAAHVSLGGKFGARDSGRRCYNVTVYGTGFE